MKKVIAILAVSLMTLGFVSCETEDTADQERLYIDSPDGDDAPPVGRD